MNDFEKSFIASFIGYWIGHKIDQTRFGIWFNNNPVIDFIWQLGKLILLLTFVWFGILFLYILITGWGK